MGVPVSLSIPLHLEEKESGTCTHRRRICNVEHAMLNNSTSRRRVCLARNDLTKGFLMSQVPLPFAAFIGIDWADKKPTLDAAKRARQDTLVTFFRSHNVRSQATITRRLEAIQSEEPLTTDSAVIRAAVAARRGHHPSAPCRERRRRALRR
jgi:hypothetical protein